MENTEVKDTPLNLFKGIKEAFHYWKWFLISVVVCVTLSVLYVWITQPVYQVDANVLIKTESEKGEPVLQCLLCYKDFLSEVL